MCITSDFKCMGKIKIHTIVYAILISIMILPKKKRKFNIIYIIREEGSIFAPQRIPFCMALGVAACTVGKVRVSTVFMCVCSTFRPSDFLLFVKNGFVVGVRCQGNSESLKECEYPHCASATRRLALDNRTYSAQLANSTHTRCRPTLSWMGGARWPSG